MHNLYLRSWSVIAVGRVAQSVQRLATGWTVRGSNLGGGRDFSHLSRPALGPTQPPVQWVPGLSPGVKSGRGVTLTPHPLLVPWSWKSRAIPLLPLWVIRPVQSLSAYTRVHFILPYQLLPPNWKLNIDSGSPRWYFIPITFTTIFFYYALRILSAIQIISTLYRVIKKSLCTWWCTVIVRCTETFWSACTNECRNLHGWYYGRRKLQIQIWL